MGGGHGSGYECRLPGRGADDPRPQQKEERMGSDIFGDLQDWGRVLEAIERLRLQHELEAHQPGLARILRYRGNWQLTESVLRAAVDFERRDDVLAAEVLHVLVDAESNLETRVLAARAAGALLRRPAPQGSSFDERRALETIEDVARQPGPPVLQQAAADALQALRARGR